MTLRSHRVISGLLSAHPCARPASIPAGRLRGVKRLGQKYELAFGKALQEKFGNSATVRLGQWFVFIDANGHGYCQPDVLVHTLDEIIIFECKLTDVETARTQLSLLYAPVVSRVYNMPTRLVVVTRHLTKETDVSRVTDGLHGVMASRREVIPTLHWRERNPL